MVTRVSNLLQRYSKGWLILLAALLSSAFMFFVLPITQALLKGDSGTPGPLDLQVFYTPGKAYEMVAAYGEYGRSFYRNVELSVDIVYPIAYTLFFGLLLTWLLQRGFPAKSRMQRLNVVPLGCWLFDLLENLGIVSMLSIYPSTPAMLAWLTALFTLVKWLFVAAATALILVALVMAIRNGFKTQEAVLT